MTMRKCLFFRIAAGKHEIKENRFAHYDRNYVDMQYISTNFHRVYLLIFFVLLKIRS